MFGEECEPEFPADFCEPFLKQFLKTRKDVERYAQFFPQKFLLKFFLRNQLQEGKEISQEEMSLLTEPEIKRLSELVLLDIRDNPEHFSPGQTVVLSAQLKNIRELRLSVFEINTVNFLLDRKDQDFNAIALEGLVPLMQQVHVYPHKSIVVHKETFEFASLDGKPRGVYVIEFCGQGVYAKAIVRIGALGLVQDRVTGRNCLVVDEQSRVCRGPKTGLFIGSKFFGVNADGVVAVPDAVQKRSERVVVVHDDFASVASLQIRDNNYSLRSSLVFNEEEIAAGVQAHMGLGVSLWNNGTRLPVARLKEPEVVLSMLTSDNVEKKLTIPDVEFADDADFFFSFLVPAKTKSFEVTVKGKLMDAGFNSEVLTLFSKKSFTLRSEPAKQMVNFFLQRTDGDDYVLSVKSLSGDDIRGLRLDLRLSTWFERGEKSFALVTDSFGKVLLRGMQDVTVVTVKPSGQGKSSDSYSK